ncbi:MAG TPA: MFS transporter [Acidimicrobiales bacterium]|nr:MFS transporter [Acidimicrobiales bacterium]
MGVGRSWLKGRTFAPLRRRAFAILVAGYGLSAVGDGMAAVAVSWLAISVAHGRSTDLVVGGAIAAYYLPGVAAWFALGRFFAGWDGRKLVLAEAALRAVALGAVTALASTGLLDPALYIALLGISSLFGLLGISGDLAAVVELLPPTEQLAGNSLVTLASFGASIVGPALAGGLIAAAGAAAAIAADAASFVLLVVAAYASRRLLPPPARELEARSSSMTALRTLAGLPSVVGITILCVFFFGVYGPVEVALPIYVHSVLRAGAGVLGGFWALFSIGAAAGALGASHVERLGVWRVVVLSVLGWGACLVPLGPVASVPVGLGALAAGGLFYGPFLPFKRAIIQRDTPAGLVAPVAAASAMFTVPASPIGTALGGPIVATVGARATLTGSGAVTVAIAALSAAVLAGRRRGRRRNEPAPGYPGRRARSSRAISRCPERAQGPFSRWRRAVRVRRHCP